VRHTRWRVQARDAVSYWQDWRPDTLAAANGRRFTRVVASMFLRVEQLCELYLETAAALRHAVAGTAPDEPVATQGHVLTTGDLMLTLAVEATIHHLDLVESLAPAPEPSAEGLLAVRRTLDGLLGRPVPIPWDDAYYARVATGRLALSSPERARLDTDAARFPLLG
jgi:hypothetical protein